MNTYQDWIGTDAYDPDGDKIGEIADVYVDNRTHRPEWLAVHTGLFGGKNTFVPIHGSQIRTDEDGNTSLLVAYDKDQIKDAPRMDPEGELSPIEEQNLWAHYGYEYHNDSKTFGYGRSYDRDRADKDFMHTDTVHVDTTAQVTVPVEANVRLRRYQTQNQRTERRVVEVPVTETEEHVEVQDVQATTKGVRS